MKQTLTFLLPTLLLTLSAAGEALTAGVNRVGYIARERGVTELVFKGKEFVRNHHLTVPFRPLVPVPDKGIGPVDLAGNLIIHGDNLHALKALLPMYAGKVDVVFIDPPYNTGNEGWAYNDNVNSPMIKEWLHKEVGLDDGLRHDKWCAMMWPRLVLLRELMSDNGSIWITLDDNEVHRAVEMLTEIFGSECHETSIAWEKRFTRSNNATRFSSSKDYVIVFRKSDAFRPGKELRSAESQETYENPDQDPRGPWISVSYVNPASKEARRNLVYPIRNPHKGTLVEHGTNAWKYEKQTHEKHVEENKLWWGKTGELNYPRLKVFMSEGMVPIDIWSHSFAGTTDQAFKELENIVGRGAFETIKPTKLIQRVLELASKPESIVLDCFAGSGTTAHAVLDANNRSKSNCRFILVEAEDYADSLTAERVRRVANGYAFEGNKREQLHSESITFTSLKKSEKLLDKITAIENLEGHRFDEIKKEVKDGELIVTGIKKVTEKVEGLGGTFTYCELGEPINLDRILTGESLPAYEPLASALFHMITNRGFDPKGMDESKNYVGTSDTHHVWMLYKPDLAWLKSPAAALTLDGAKAFAASMSDGKAHYVIAATRYVSDRLLREENVPVDFVPLPYALYRIEQA